MIQYYKVKNMLYNLYIKLDKQSDKAIIIKEEGELTTKKVVNNPSEHLLNVFARYGCSPLAENDFKLKYQKT